MHWRGVPGVGSASLRGVSPGGQAPSVGTAIAGVPALMPQCLHGAAPMPGTMTEGLCFQTAPVRGTPGVCLALLSRCTNCPRAGIADAARPRASLAAAACDH